MAEATAVGERGRRLSLAAHRDWGLWIDWCTATNHDPAQAEGRALARFLADVPATIQVQDRRLRNIRRALGQPAVGLPRPTIRVPSRIGPPWLSYTEALSGLRHEWFPEGVAARRDALVLVLAARGFTRPRIRNLQPAHVTAFPVFAVDGIVLTRHRDPALCARCALARWLTVLDAYRDRSGRDIETLLTEARAYPRPRHDCHDRFGEGWQTTPWLIPAIDKHGAIAFNPRPVTARALTGILTRRFTASPNPLTTAAPTETSARGPGRRSTHEEEGTAARIGDGWVRPMPG